MKPSDIHCQYSEPLLSRDVLNTTGQTQKQRERPNQKMLRSRDWSVGE